jgi:hypothetical protein
MKLLEPELRLLELETVLLLHAHKAAKTKHGMVGGWYCLVLAVCADFTCACCCCACSIPMKLLAWSSTLMVSW